MFYMSNIHVYRSNKYTEAVQKYLYWDYINRHRRVLSNTLKFKVLNFMSNVIHFCTIIHFNFLFDLCVCVCLCVCVWYIRRREQYYIVTCLLHPV